MFFRDEVSKKGTDGVVAAQPLIYLKTSASASYCTKQTRGAPSLIWKPVAEAAPAVATGKGWGAARGSLRKGSLSDIRGPQKNGWMIAKRKLSESGDDPDKPRLLSKCRSASMFLELPPGDQPLIKRSMSDANLHRAEDMALKFLFRGQDPDPDTREKMTSLIRRVSARVAEQQRRANPIDRRFIGVNKRHALKHLVSLQ